MVFYHDFLIDVIFFLSISKWKKDILRNNLCLSV